VSEAFLAPFLGGGALEASARAEMTFPNVVNDLFMLAPSFRRAPVAPVELALSLPARSTRLGSIQVRNNGHCCFFLTVAIDSPVAYLILETFSVSRFVSMSYLFCVNKTVNTACDRLDVSFMLVDATVLA